MIIFINGSINSGKSTIAKLLATKLSNTAMVEIDLLRAMIDWMPLDKAIPINLENAVFLIRNFSKRGLSVVVPYPLSQKNYEYMISSLSDLNESVYVFTLAPKLEKVIMNRGTRELTELERERIKYHYEIGIHKPLFGEIIDNSDTMPDEVIEKIIKIINTNI